MTFITNVTGGWTQWDEWSPCRVTCGKGVSARRRTCRDDNRKDIPDNEKTCKGIQREQQECDMGSCSRIEDVKVEGEDTSGLVTGYRVELKTNSEFEFLPSRVIQEPANQNQSRSIEVEEETLMTKADRVVQEDAADNENIYDLQETETETPKFYGEYSASIEEDDFSLEGTSVDHLEGYYNYEK